MGLNPHTHLGKDLAEMQPFLTKLNTRFGINVCGEGGEYETLTLDCPLFKNYKICLDGFDIVQHSPDTIAPVGVLHPSKFHLDCKLSTSSLSHLVSEPCVKDVGVDFEKGLASQIESEAYSFQSWQLASKQESDIIHSRRHGTFVVCSCRTRSSMIDFGIDEELGFALTEIQKDLKEDGLSWGDVLYIHLYIDDMGAFNSANQMYMKVITEKLCINGVPSRSTVGLGLLENNLGRILVEAIVAKKTDKKVLHVQSISCWAPSCIGPYSQATVCHDLLYMAGQLGLDPPTMALVSGGAASEMKQALKNCEAVAQVFSTSIVLSSVSILVYCSPSVGVTEKKEVETILETFLSSSEDVSCIPGPPVVYVQVRALPKGAALEVEPFLYAPSYYGESLKPSSDLKRFRRGECCQGTIVPERSLRAFFSIPLKIIPKNVNETDTVSALDFDSLPFLCAELELCLQTFSDVLAEASFNWENVLALRVMFASKVVSHELVAAAWNHTANNYLDSSAEDKLSMRSALLCLKPLFLPVLSSGREMNMEDLATLDLLAFS